MFIARIIRNASILCVRKIICCCWNLTNSRLCRTLILLPVYCLHPGRTFISFLSRFKRINFHWIVAVAVLNVTYLNSWKQCHTLICYKNSILTLCALRSCSSEFTFLKFSVGCSVFYTSCSGIWRHSCIDPFHFQI